MAHNFIKLLVPTLAIFYGLTAGAQGLSKRDRDIELEGKGLAIAKVCGNKAYFAQALKEARKFAAFSRFSNKEVDDSLRVQLPLVAQSVRSDCPGHLKRYKAWNEAKMNHLEIAAQLESAKNSLPRAHNPQGSQPRCDPQMLVQNPNDSINPHMISVPNPACHSR